MSVDARGFQKRAADPPDLKVQTALCCPTKVLRINSVRAMGLLITE